MFLYRIFINFKQYLFLLRQLVIRDFKIKYKRSYLGILWSILYPLLMMVVMNIVFSNLFKFSVPGVNYLVYLLTGLVMMNYFVEATTTAMSSVVANFGLLNKVYIPKYLFPLAKCLFSGLNFLLTLIPLYLMIIFTGTEETKLTINAAHLMLPYVFICLFFCAFGIGLILASIAVYLRDMLYIYGIITLVLNYVTPIFYDISIISENLRIFFKLNPMYQFITFFRAIILEGRIPNAASFLYCGLAAIIPLIIGVITFKAKQDKFIYYA